MTESYIVIGSIPISLLLCLAGVGYEFQTVTILSVGLI